MNEYSRIKSILQAPNLDTAITGFPSFYLTELSIEKEVYFHLPRDLRLGHLAEKVVSGLIKTSHNFEVLHENIQLMEGKRTIGELDFIILDHETNERIHLELAYKFYLYDPNISSEQIKNWIGPNRNDSLKEKLDKLKTRQFPLLYHEATQEQLGELEVEELSQKLSFLAYLYVPFQNKMSLDKVYGPAITGYYLNAEDFTEMDHSDKAYYIPMKREWGMDPAENEIWHDMKQIQPSIVHSLAEKQSLLCWQKQKELYSTFFIVWW